MTEGIEEGKMLRVKFKILKKKKLEEHLQLGSQITH